MYVRRQKTNSLYPGRNLKILSNDRTNINKFRSQVQSDYVNELNMPRGTSQFLQNMEYLRSGGSNFALRTRRGTDLVKDITLGVVGAGNFNINETNYFVWKEKTSGDVKYFNPTTETIATVQAGETATQTYFWNFNFPGGSNLYSCNTTDGIKKIDSSFNYSTIFNTGVDVFAFSNISGRLFAAIGHTVYYSLIQQKDASNTNNLESFNASTQNFKPSPDDGDGIKAITDNGEITFFWKDTGIWALINAEEDENNWLIPKCDAEQGTKSPKTVKYARYGSRSGFIYLASDKTLRFFNGRVVRNSGSKPTLEGADDLVISNNFTKLLEDIPVGMLPKCNAGYVDRYYVLNIASQGSTVLDVCIVIDTEKLDRDGMPYWFYCTNWDFDEFIKTTNTRMFGFHKEGFISETFINNRYYDEVPTRISVYDDDLVVGSVKQIAIPWGNYLFPVQPSNNQMKLHECYVGWKSEGNWSINFLVDSWDKGDAVPAYNEGVILELQPNISGQSYFDFAFFDQSYFASGSGAVSQNTGGSGRGHYFKYGLYNNNRGEYATIYDIQPHYQWEKSSPMGKNF